jgi:hypothetical protein
VSEKNAAPLAEGLRPHGSSKFKSSTFNDQTPLPIFGITCAARRVPHGTSLRRQGQLAEGQEKEMTYTGRGNSRAHLTRGRVWILVADLLFIGSVFVLGPEPSDI